MPNIDIGSEFHSMPLDFVVSAPLTAAVQAQATAAATLKNYLTDIQGETAEFKSASTFGANGGSAKTISVPLLACVPVPHLRIDSITTHFKFEISQVEKSSKKDGGGLDANVGGGGILSMLNVSFKGNITHESSRESTTNRSGMLEITVHASESPIPAGLDKVMNWLVSTIAIPNSPVPNGTVPLAPIPVVGVN